MTLADVLVVWSFWMTTLSTSCIIGDVDLSSTIYSHFPPLNSSGVPSFKKDICRVRLRWMDVDGLCLPSLWLGSR